MAPEQLSAITALINALGDTGKWPLGVIILFSVIGPWIAAFLLVNFQSKRFEKVVSMYENNVSLVEDYAKLANDLHDVVIMNTQIITTLVDSIKTNQYCLAVRLEKKIGGVQI